MPYPPIDGGAQVMHYATKGLIANHVSVKILAMNPTRIFVDTALLPTEYIESTHFESITVDTRLNPFSALINLFGRDSYLMSRFKSTRFENKLIEILKIGDFNIIQLEHLYLCKYLNVIRGNSKARIVLRPQNIEYIIWERYFRNISNPLKRTMLRIAVNRLRKFEQKIGDKLDGIMALTDEDAEVFRQYTNVPVEVLPMGYDYTKIEDYDFDLQHNSLPVVYHLASMDWLPNMEAVKWFLVEVLPLIGLDKLNAKLVIAGRRMPKQFFRYNNDFISIQESIDNPLDFQADKSIMIVPLLSGSGIRAKIIEGLALGKAIISTTIGAQGINYTNGRNIIIADSPREFADSIIKCINDRQLRVSLSTNARVLSRTLYHYFNTGRNMLSFYNRIL